MTRQKALKMLIEEYPFNTTAVSMILDKFEKIGLIKFDEIEILYKSDDYMSTLGGIRLEYWPEGLVLWVGGEIRYRSWK